MQKSYILRGINMNFKNSFHPFAIITILFWSSAFAFTKLSLQHFSAFSLGFLRYLIGAVTLIIFGVLTKMKLPEIKDIPWFLAAGASGFFFYIILFNMGLLTVSSATSSVIIATAPLITAFLSRFIYHEKLMSFQWAAFLLEFVGVIVLTLMNSTFSVNIGLLWLFIAAFSFSIYNLLQRKLTKKYTALQVTTFSVVSGSCMLAVFAPAAIRELSTAPTAQFFYITYLGVFPSAISYLAWAKAFSKSKNTSHVSNYLFINPFMASIFGFVINREVPGSAAVIGGGIILFGVLIFNFGGSFFKASAKKS